MERSITRRAMLAASVSSGVLSRLPGSPALSSSHLATQKSKPPLPSVGEFVRFLDPVTENPVVRLTHPAYPSFLPSSTSHFVSAKERFLIFSSRRGGPLAPFQLDLRTGLLKALLPTQSLAPQSPCLDARERFLYVLDGTTLKQLGLASKKVEVLGEGLSAFSLVNGQAAPVIVRAGHLESLNRNGAPLAENVAPWCLVRPNGAGCAWGRNAGAGEQEFWYSSFSNGSSSPSSSILLSKGRVTNPVWAPDSRSLLFLRDVPSGETLVSEIHEVSPETGVAIRVSGTSQFAAFSPNGDGSVFVGASRSKAQRTIVLLLRSVQREITLCEHRASNPALVSPVFSPDSRRVYFQSDFEGPSALYSVNVELLVEPTGSG